MTNTDPGPGRYRIVGMMRDAVARLQVQFDAALAGFTDSVNAELTQVDTAITNLNAVAGQAQAAIEASSEDRAALHAEQDTQAAALTALAARVAALEAAAVPPVG